MNRGTLPLLLLLVPGALVAQTARLTVRVEGGGAPLAGARVTIGPVSRSTSQSGEAVFPLDPGRHLVRAMAVGWEPDSTSVELTAATDSSITIALAAAAVELEALVVTTTRSPRRVEDEALRVEVIDTEELEEKQLMTPGDIVMLLNETGGVRVQASNPSLGGAGIRIRGLPGRYTQVLADGLPLFGERIGGLGPLQIPPIDLGQVEVVKGVASAWYGGSALGGVINLISRPPEAGSTALLNATSLGGADATSYLGGTLGGRWSATALIGTHYQPRVDRDGDGWTDVPGYRRAVVRPRLFWRDSIGQLLLLTAGAMVETRSGGTRDGRVAPDGAPYVERLATTRLDAGLVGRNRVAGTWWLATRAAITTSGHRHRFGPVGEPDRHTTGFAEAALSGTRGATDLVAGAAVTIERFRSERFPALDYRFVVPGVFAQVERSWGPAVVAASARVDHHERYGTIASPRLSGLVRLADAWSVRASVGAGYTGPTPFVDETERNGLSRLVPLGGLSAERAVSGSIDAHGTAGAFELNLSVFGVRVSDPLQIRETAAGLELFNAAGPTRAGGLDLSATFRRGSLGVTGSYALIGSSEPDPDGVGRRTIPLTPRHTAGLVGVHETEAGRVGLELYYTGGQFLERDPYRVSGSPFLVIGLLVERRIGPLRAFLNLENLADVRQTRKAPLVRPERDFDGSWTVGAWAPLDGRTLNGGIRWSW